MGRQSEIDRQLSGSIRRELGSPMTRRFARSLPFLHAGDVLPAKILDVLQRIEEAEAYAGPAGGRG